MIWEVRENKSIGGERSFYDIYSVSRVKIATLDSLKVALDIVNGHNRVVSYLMTNQKPAKNEPVFIPKKYDDEFRRD